MFMKIVDNDNKIYRSIDRWISINSTPWSDSQTATSGKMLVLLTRGLVVLDILRLSLWQGKNRPNKSLFKKQEGAPNMSGNKINEGFSRNNWKTNVSRETKAWTKEGREMGNHSDSARTQLQWEKCSLEKCNAYPCYYQWSEICVIWNLLLFSFPVV